MNAHSVVAAILAGLLAASAWHPALAGRCERAERVRVPLRDDAGFLSIPASIAGQPVRLMIDTGSDAGLLTPDAARGLGLVAGGVARIRLEGTGGAAHPLGIARIAELTVGGLRLEDVLVPVGPLPAAPGLSPPVVGLIGGDVLSRFDLDVDVPRARLSFYAVSLPSLACAPPPAWSGAFMTVPLQAHGVRLSLAARLDGHPVRALLDTGARSRIISEAAALRVGVEPGALAADPGGITSGIDLREQTYHWHRFRTLSIGTETTRSPVLTVSPLSGPFDMLLGADWFARREVWISYATRQLFWRRPG